MQKKRGNQIMSTRCRIGIQNKDGTITSVYCHHDGYPEYVGKCLVDYYTDEAKIRKLMELGDMSSLGTEPVGDPDGWDFSKRNYDDRSRCVTYKDRGEDAPARMHNTVQEYHEYTTDCWGEYCYLFRDGEWYFVRSDLSLHKVKESQGYKESVYWKWDRR